MKRQTQNVKSKLLLTTILFVFVILPFVVMIFNINLKDIKILLNSGSIATIIGNSLITSLISSIFSVSIAFGLAWLINRTKIRYKEVFKVLLTVPMLIPSIAHGLGLILLLGNNGIVTQIFNLNFNLFGYLGIILGSILYTFPVAFLLLSDAFQYEDYSSYEAAEVLGIDKFRQFLNITIPNLSKTLISTFFAVFTMTFTDYGVPLMVGGKLLTLSSYMYREVIGLMNFSSGSVIGLFLLIPALVAFIFDLRTLDDKASGTVNSKFKIKENRTRDIIAYVVLSISMIVIFSPIVTFGYLSFVEQFPQNLNFSLNHLRLAQNFGVIEYLLNSITISFISASLGVVVSYLVAYLTARSERDFSTLTLHLISLISLAIPGVVLGLSYVLFFNGTFIYGTIYILILVNIVHFFASPYLLAYNALSNFSSSFEDVAASLNISSRRMILDVYLPSTKETVIEMFSYFFINSMITISAVSFLSNLKNMPLALLIPQFDAQSLIEPTALIALIIFIINVIVKVSIFTIKRNMYNKGEVYESK